jgi:hypothetical protein
MPFSVWIRNVEKYLYHYDVDYGITKKLRNSRAAKPLFVACAFDFFEIVERYLSEGNSTTDILSESSHSPLQVAAMYGSCQAISVFLADARTDISEAVLKIAAANKSGKDMMSLLLEQRGHEFKITDEVVKEAAENYDYGEVLTLLLEQRGHEFKITEEVAKAAAENWDSGKEVMALLRPRIQGHRRGSQRGSRK